MQPPILNGVVKPADVIAKGPHVYNEATRKYEERPIVFKEYPRAMWHETEGYKEAQTSEDQLKMEAAGWQTHPFPEKPKKETVVTSPVNLAEVLLQQELEMKALRAQLDSLTKPEEKRGPGRPPKAVEV